MLTRKVFLLMAVLSLVSCSSAPKSGPGPATKMARVRSNPTKATITMSDPTVADYIVKDVSDTLEAGAWRWTFDRPELRFQLKQATGQKLEVHFAVADATFKTTGPVTINFFVNNKPLGMVKVTKPGDQVFTKAVPADWLTTTDFTTVAVEARPVWTSETDGKHLTLILTQMGFVPAAAS